MNKKATRVHLVNHKIELHLSNFAFPGTEFLDDIEFEGRRVGYISYGVSPLHDRLYINMIKINPPDQKKGAGSGALWKLWLAYKLPIVPLRQYHSSYGFWNLVRSRFQVAGAIIENELHTDQQMNQEQERWAHLVPEPGQQK